MSTIRPAAPEDVPTILGLIRELAEFEKLSHQVISTEERLHDALFGPSPAAEALVASTDGDDAAGFALFFQNYSTFVGRPGLYLEDVYVKPAHRGTGIGKALLAAVNRVALDRNCGRLEWSVLDWNTNAIEFYEALGANVMPDWRIVRLDRDAIENLARKTGGS